LLQMVIDGLPREIIEELLQIELQYIEERQGNRLHPESSFLTAGACHAAAHFRQRQHDS